MSNCSTSAAALLLSCGLPDTLEVDDPQQGAAAHREEEVAARVPAVVVAEHALPEGHPGALPVNLDIDASRGRGVSQNSGQVYTLLHEYFIHRITIRLSNLD